MQAGQQARESFWLCQFQTSSIVCPLNARHKSGTQLLARSWTFSCSGDKQEVDILKCPWLNTFMLLFFLMYKLCWGKREMYIVCAHAQTSVKITLPLDGVLEGWCLGSPLFYWVTSMYMWTLTNLSGKSWLGGAVIKLKEASRVWQSRRTSGAADKYKLERRTATSVVVDAKNGA